jgi:iron complex outermembrane recepter protein
MKTRYFLLGVSLSASIALGDTFTLGQIDVQGTKEPINMMNQTLTSQQIAQTNAQTLSQALNNVSGISISNIGARNESTISVRGFDSNHILVFEDGVPLYMPYDGEFDYNRFLTDNISQIDISKGYSSVAYGGNAMGGVINIITKKPTKELQGDIKVGTVLDSQMNASSYVTSFNVGSRMKHYYVQLGGVAYDRNHYRLSNGYTVTASQPTGNRLRSKARDYSVNLKLGYVADDGSEIAVGYAAERGKKQQPPSTDAALAKVRYWDWPTWNTTRYYVTGQKNLGNSYLKTTLYYSSYKNDLYSYDNANYDTMTRPYAFGSEYDDHNYGARVEYSIQLRKHFVTASVNYQKNVHNGYDLDPKVKSEDFENHTYSIGLSDIWTISSKWKILAGASEDIVSADKIYKPTAGYEEMFRLTTQSAFNPEAAVVYTIDNTQKIKASIAKKTYNPTMKDRYSSKFNQYVPNPDLRPSTSVNYELDYTKRIHGFMASADGFYTVVNDAIQDEVWDQNSSLKQEQNIGNIRHIGAEINIRYKIKRLDTGGNYTYIYVKNDTNPGVQVTGVPKHQVFAYAQFHFTDKFAFYGDMKIQDGFYSQITDGSYIKSSLTTFGSKVIYKPLAYLSAEIGVKNLTDRIVEYEPGFPTAGREYFANLTYKF